MSGSGHPGASAGDRTAARILVAGTGAIGSVFACLLREAGHDVTALGRERHVGEIAASGLGVEGIWGEHHADGIVPAAGPGDLAADYDAVLVTCKSYQTAELLEQIGDRAAADGAVISLQNGLGNVERLQAVHAGRGVERVVAGRVIFGAEITGRATVRVTVEAEPVLLGRPGGGHDRRAADWARTFDEAGVHCRATDAIEAALWGKVFYNAALNPLGALLGLTYGELAADTERRAVMDRVIAEAHAVAQAEGVSLPWASAAEYIEHFHANLVPSTAGHRSSMLQDIERGKPTEIDAICGEVCRRGDAHGIEVSLNRLLTVLVRARVGRGRDRPADDERTRSRTREGR